MIVIDDAQQVWAKLIGLKPTIKKRPTGINLGLHSDGLLPLLAPASPLTWRLPSLQFQR